MDIRKALTLLLILSPMAATSAQEPVARIDFHAVRGRLPRFVATGRHEGESDLSLQGTARPQNLSHYGRHWSGDSHLLWDGLVGESMRTEFQVRRASRYQLTLQLTAAPDYGRFAIRLNERKIANVDLYSPLVELAERLELGEFDLVSGKQELEFQLIGANDKAVKFQGKGYLLGIDYVQLVDKRPPPEPARRNPNPVTVAIDTPQAAPKEIQSFLSKHCLRCHREADAESDIRFDRFDLGSAKLELLSKVVHVLARREMPPGDEPQPKELKRESVRRSIDVALEARLRASSPLPPVVMRRLNRYEYNNAVRDLLQLKGDVFALPEKVIRPYDDYFDPASGRFPDTVKVGNRALGKNQVEKPILTGVAPFAIDLQAEHGFNNRGADLSISPILLEGFLRLGRSIVDSPELEGYSQLGKTLWASPAGDRGESSEETARTRLQPFLERAFRKPIDEATLARYVKFFRREHERIGTFEAAMKSVVAAVLASPRFLFVVEKAPIGSGQPLTDHEIATRLSLFLWSSIPDDALLRDARAGRLSNPDVLELQVRRMLEDPRSKALSDNFARQWLRLDQLIAAVPDFQRFQVYYSRIGCEQWKFGLQMMIEPLLLFESVMVEDRSIMLLIDSNYSYRSNELQAWYDDNAALGKRANRNRFNTAQQSYRRTRLANRRQGGVMTTAGVLTMTSSPLRTSPITRGSWVATVVFNRPPPPPPDVVPPIEADDAAIEAQGLTLRQRLKQHQVNDSCKSCHAKIDPLGFALENYDAVGRWRDRYRSGLPIDATGKLDGDRRFKDVVELKDALLERPERFMRAFSEHMLSYALGRELKVADKPAVDRIMRSVVADRGQFSSVVVAIATSYPFLHKASQPR